MLALGINFARQPRPVSALGVVLFVAGMAAAGAAVGDYLEARDGLQRVQARQARWQRQQRFDVLALRRQSPASALRAEVPAVERVVAQLRLPWDGLLRGFENHTDPSVALLSIESLGQSHTLRLTGEAKTMADVVAYISRLRASPWIVAATLSGHEERLAGPIRVIRFSLDATWNGPA